MHPSGHQLLFEGGDAIVGCRQLRRQPLNLHIWGEGGFSVLAIKSEIAAVEQHIFVFAGGI